MQCNCLKYNYLIFRTPLKKTLEHAGLENIIGKENICSHINEALERSKEIK